MGCYENIIYQKIITYFFYFSMDFIIFAIHFVCLDAFTFDDHLNDNQNVNASLNDHQTVNASDKFRKYTQSNRPKFKD